MKTALSIIFSGVSVATIAYGIPHRSDASVTPTAR